LSHHSIRHQIHNPEFRLAELRRLLQEFLENGLRIARLTVDDVENFGKGRLLFTNLRQLTVALSRHLN
jgi:hypothetical protein